VQGRRIERIELYVRQNTPMSGSITVHEAVSLLLDSRFYITTEDQVRWALVRSPFWDRVEPNLYRRVGG